MHIEKSFLNGACLFKTESVRDHRGAFTRLYCQRELTVLGADKLIQINLSRTARKGALRGLHYQQPPRCEEKFVHCIRGRVYDVVVDLRPDSPSFLQWHAEELSPEDRGFMFIPKGFAHGFQTLEPDTELLYFHTEYYSPGYEGGLRYDDPALGIHWPLSIVDISEKDRNHEYLPIDFQGIRI